MFLRLESSVQSMTWSMYGRFTLAVCVCSCAGFAAWIAYGFYSVASNRALQARISNVGVNDTISDLESPYDDYSLMLRAQSVFFLFYPIELMFSSFSKLVIIDRMLNFYSMTSRHDDSKELLMRRCKRCLFSLQLAAFLLTVAGWISNVVAASFNFRGSQFAAQAQAIFQASDLSVADDSDESDAMSYNADLGSRANIVFSMCEVGVRTLIVLALVISIALFQRRMNAMPEMFETDKQTLRRVQITVACNAPPPPSPVPSVAALALQNPRNNICCGCSCGNHRLTSRITLILSHSRPRSGIIVMYLPRALLDCSTTLIRVIDFKFDAVDFGDCPGGPCDCSATISAMLFFDFTPEILLCLNLLSSPVTLLVCLWGMTSPRMIVLMRDARLGNMETLRNKEFMPSCYTADNHVSHVGSSLVSTSSSDSVSTATPHKRGNMRSMS